MSTPTPHQSLEPQPISRGARMMTLVAAFLGWMFDGLEMGLFPLVARPALRELMGAEADTSIGVWMGWITAGFLVGAACGGILFGWLGDRIGRVRAMVWSVLTYAIFSGLCGFSESPLQLAILRFMAALGMGGEWSLGVALVMEVWPGKSRPLLAGLIGSAANVGFLLIAVVGLGLTQFIEGAESILRASGMSEDWVAKLIGGDKSAWRLLMFIGATPALLTIFVRFFVPESRLWQHAAAHAPKTRVRDIFARNVVTRTVLGTSLAGMALIGTWASIQWVTPWANKLAADTDSAATASSTTQISLAIGAIIGTMAAALSAEWFSRRKAYFALCLASLLVCAYLFRSPVQWSVTAGWFERVDPNQSFFGGERAFNWYFVLLAGLAGGVTAGFYGWLPLYLPELFPTRIRATAQGFAFNFGRVLAAIGALQGGRLLDYFNQDYARMGAIMSLVYLAGMVLIWFCPETKGQPLPD
ncbi:MAG: MFS transporter [Planctomycetota bacterium]|nr:MAG: MFS transporter [Planctomycetota bacterium]